MEECLNESRSVTVKAGTMVQLPVSLEVLPCTVRMNWTSTRNTSLIFTVEYKLDSSKAETNRTVIRKAGSDAPRKLELEFKNPGVCIFSWDNSSSFFTGSDVTYTIVIVVPNEKLHQFRMATRIQTFARMSQARKRFKAAEVERAKQNVPPETFRFVEGEPLSAETDIPPIEASASDEFGAASADDVSSNREDFGKLSSEELRSRISEVIIPARAM